MGGQPFGEEATRHVSQLVLGRVVHLKLLARDQYGRLVAMVYYPRFQLFPPRLHDNLSMELLRSGLGVLYRGSNADYDGMKEEFERIEDEAKQRKRGLWKQKKPQLPSEYKAKIKAKGKAKA